MEVLKHQGLLTGSVVLGGKCLIPGCCCLCVPDSLGVVKAWVVPGMARVGGLEMRERFQLEACCTDLGGDVQVFPLPSCSLNLGSSQDLKAPSFHQKFLGWNGQKGHEYLHKHPKGAACGRAGDGGAVTRRWQRLHPAPFPRLHPAPHGARAGLAAETLPVPRRAAIPRLGGHLPRRFPLQIIRISKSKDRQLPN